MVSVSRDGGLQYMGNHTCRMPETDTRSTLRRPHGIHQSLPCRYSIQTVSKVFWGMSIACGIPRLPLWVDMVNCVFKHAELDIHGHLFDTRSFLRLVRVQNPRRPPLSQVRNCSVV